MPINQKEASPAPPAVLTSPRELRGQELLLFNFGCKYNNQIRKFKRLFSIKTKQLTKGTQRLTEALSMDYVARNTTIPIPRILDVFTVDGEIYIVQENIAAPVLEDIWCTLSPEEQQSSMDQLKDCLDQLRALEPPDPEHVQSIDGSACSDFRIASEYGPFDNHDEFHKYFGHEFFRMFPEKYPLLQDVLSKVAGQRYRTVFSHGDMGPHNVLWKDGKIWVIDWEMAGWFPEYWDYMRTYHVTAFAMVMLPWWEMVQETVTDRYDDEVELHLQIGNYIVML